MKKVLDNACLSNIRVLSLRLGKSYTLEHSCNTLVYVSQGMIRVGSKETTIKLELLERQMLFLHGAKSRVLSPQFDATVIIFNWCSFDEVYRKLPSQSTLLHSTISVSVVNNEYVLEVDPSLDVFLKSVEQVFALGLSTAEMYQIKCWELFILLRSSMDHKMFIKLFSAVYDAKHDFFKHQVESFVDVAKTLPDLIKMMGMSRAHFHRVFRDAFGTTPYQWLLSRKAEKVRDYLYASSDPLKVIAQDLGFGSHSNLNAFCLKFFGKTAKKLKNENNNNHYESQVVG